MGHIWCLLAWTNYSLKNVPYAITSHEKFVLPKKMKKKKKEDIKVGVKTSKYQGVKYMCFVIGPLPFPLSTKEIASCT